MTYIIGQGSTSDVRSIALETRKRNHLANEMRLEKPLKGILQVASLIEKAFPGTKLVSATAMYNCYGLAFASRRSCLVDGEEARKSLRDDGFRRLPFDPSAWRYGDIVLYCTSYDPLSHVAVIVEPVARKDDSGDFDTRVVSAWGETGEYLHWIDPKHPLLGKPYEVHTIRPSESEW